jgi:beta-lactamase regulating signal transducer with metallopeptidase domain
MTEINATVPVQLADPALRALVVAAVAGIALAIFQVKATSLRLLAWRGVLYAALAMPLLAWMLPPLHVPVPELIQSETETSARTVTAPQASVATSAVTLARGESSLRTQAHTSATHRETTPVITLSPPATGSSFAPADSVSISWPTLATTIYFAIVLFFLLRMGIGLIFSRHLIRTSEPITNSRIVSRLATLANASGLAFVSEPAESRLIAVPITIGIFRSRIVLPSGWREWDEEKLDAILAHELSHVARRDALTQFLSLLHRAIFWFSPLAWWLNRHLAELAEQASDEAALSCGANRNDYARTLIGFFEILHTTPGRVWWQGVSMAQVGQAEKRLEKILAWKGIATMSLKKSMVIAIFALAVPAVYLTATVHAANPQDAQAAPAPPPPQPSPVPSASDIPAPAQAAKPSPFPAARLGAPVVSRAGKTAVSPVVVPTPVAAITPPVPTAALAPVAPIHGPAPLAVRPAQSYSYGSGQSYSSGHGSGKGYSYAFGYDDEQRFVIVTGNSDSMTMSGTGEDARHVEKLKKQIPGDFIWFSRDEKSYIIRDQATIARARSFWAPQEELGKKQEALGKQQEELGRQQEALGWKQEEVHVKVPDMTAELDRVKAKLQKLGPTATMEQIGDLQSEIGELQSKIGEIQSEAGEQQGKLGEEQGALGEKQGKLGEEQGKLGEQQAALAEKATRDMKQLLDEAIKSGKAQPEPQSGGETGTL